MDYWTLANIRLRVRELTGRTSENRLSQAELDGHINNYYLNHLPDLLTPDSLQSLFTYNTAAGVPGVEIPTNIRALYPPVFINSMSVYLTHDVGWFNTTYPDNETAAQGQPATVLYFDRTLTMAPVPDDIYPVKIHALYQPEALVKDDDLPVDPRWGEALAVGAAALIYFDNGDFEEATHMGDYLKYQLSLIRHTNILNWEGMRAEPQF